MNNYNQEYFWLELTQNYSIYKKKKDNIWIIKNDETICDISDESLLIRERLNGKKTMTLLNYNIIKDKGRKLGFYFDSPESKIDKMIKIGYDRNMGSGWIFH